MSNSTAESEKSATKKTKKTVEKAAVQYAVIRSGGKQHRVVAGGRVLVAKLAGKAGDKFETTDVLCVGDGKEGGEVKIGAPLVAGAKVSGTIVEQLRDKKVIVYRKRRRKGFTKKRGHRQDLTRVLIESISF